MDKKENKKRVVWFHFNKPASLSKGKPQISIHYNKTCYIVDNVVCQIPTYGHIQKCQPRFIMKAKCNKFEIKDNVGYIN